MMTDTLRRLGVFLLLSLVQGLVLNRIHLFGCATPLLYVCFVVMLPRNYPRWAALLWSFFLGLVADMFANTPGVAAASMTLIGFLQPYLIELFLPREPEPNQRASAKSLGVWRFASLAAIIVIVYCLVFFALEAFSFSAWAYWLQCAGGSALITFVLLMTIESLRK